MQAWLRQDMAGGRQVERLVLRVNGDVADAPIKPFPNVVGIDLGPGTAPGSIVAVYTRCTGGLFHERCSIYELDWPAAASAACRRSPRAARASPIRRCGPGATRSGASRSRAASAPGATSASTPACAARSGWARAGPGSTDVDANVVAYAGGASGNRVQHYEIRVHRLRGRADCRIAKQHRAARARPATTTR